MIGDSCNRLTTLKLRHLRVKFRHSPRKFPPSVGDVLYLKKGRCLFDGSIRKHIESKYLPLSLTLPIRFCAMTNKPLTPNPTLPSVKADNLGGYQRLDIDGPRGIRIATYKWEPTDGLSCATGVVYALHGLMYHSTYEWLSADADNHRVLVKHSIIDRLLSENFLVVAHDHPGHGRSSGVRGYFESIEDLVDSFDAVVHHYASIPELKGKPAVAMGISLGAATLIRAVMRAPSRVSAHVLLSPAVGAPGACHTRAGRVLRGVAGAFSAVLPRLQLLWLPKNPDPVLADAVDKDDLIARVALRPRVAREMLQLNDTIDENVEAIPFECVAIFIGGKDPVISPDFIRDFANRVCAERKDVFEFDHLGHELLREPGCEAAIDSCVGWIVTQVAEPLPSR